MFRYSLIYGPYWVFPSFNHYLKPNIFHKLKQESAKSKHPGLPLTFLPQWMSFPFLTKILSSATKKIISFYRWQTTLLSLTSPRCFPHTSCFLGEDLKDRRVSFLLCGIHLCSTEDWKSEAFPSPSVEPNLKATLAVQWYLSNYMVIPCKGKVAKVP